MKLSVNENEYIDLLKFSLVHTKEKENVKHVKTIYYDTITSVYTEDEDDERQVFIFYSDDSNKKKYLCIVFGSRDMVLEFLNLISTRLKKFNLSYITRDMNKKEAIYTSIEAIKYLLLITAVLTACMTFVYILYVSGLTNLKIPFIFIPIYFIVEYIGFIPTYVIISAMLIICFVNIYERVHSNLRVLIIEKERVEN